MTIEEDDDILDTKVKMTIIGGKIVYKSRLKINYL